MPIPGICLKGIQQSNTKRLIIKVAKPILTFNTFEMPCPNTVQGLTPIPAEINKASPSQNKTSPIIKNITEINFGFKVRALGELQNNIGIALAERIFNLNIIQQH